jgi:hypothetical protein
VDPAHPDDPVGPAVAAGDGALDDLLFGGATGPATDLAYAAHYADAPAQSASFADLGTAFLSAARPPAA